MAAVQWFKRRLPEPERPVCCRGLTLPNCVTFLPKGSDTRRSIRSGHLSGIIRCLPGEWPNGPANPPTGAVPGLPLVGLGSFAVQTSNREPSSLSRVFDGRVRFGPRHVNGPLANGSPQSLRREQDCGAFRTARIDRGFWNSAAKNRPRAMAKRSRVVGYSGSAGVALPPTTVAIHFIPPAGRRPVVSTGRTERWRLHPSYSAGIRWQRTRKGDSFHGSERSFPVTVSSSPSVASTQRSAPATWITSTASGSRRNFRR